MTDKILVLRGKVDWCKMVGAARPYTGNPKYNKGPLWSTDFAPDAASVKKITAAGISDKLRSDKPDAKNKRSYKFLTLNHLQKKADGSQNKPPIVKDANGRPWGEDNIGNGSTVDVMIKVVDYGETQGAYFQQMRVLDLVEYGGKDFEPLSEDDAFFGATQVATGSSGTAENETEAPADNEDLDDDVPF